MADLKTNLRETSVLVGVSVICKNKQDLKIYKEKVAYCMELSNIIENAENFAKNIYSLEKFNDSHLAIIENGFNLAAIIIEKLNICELKNVKWLGYDTQKNDPIDIKINNYNFSLKEDSFILENMGLYKFISQITGKEHDRGLHIFKEYAASEYEEWFRCMWRSLMQKENWMLKKDGNVSEIFKMGSKLKLEYTSGDTVITNLVPIEISSVDEYEKYTNAIIREKVVAKWINKKLRNDDIYVKMKKTCAEKAGENVVAYLNENLNYSSLARLLQIYDESYYYAKTTVKGVALLNVPASSEYTKTISVKSIACSVPKSQVNIVTTIINNKTKIEFTLRNECRFSHGQFNGTPEAKMYYDYSSDLSTLYTKI